MDAIAFLFVLFIILLIIMWLRSRSRNKRILIRQYKSENAFRHDAERLANRGYIVATVTNQQPRAGCLRILTLGLFTLIFPPKPVLIVTYRLADGLPGSGK